MKPAFSVIFLTTLIGAGQGMFLALFTGQAYAAVELLPKQAGAGFYGLGSALALLFLGGGLVASIFHLGHPERGWRAAARWRTSWLSREVIALPTTMAIIFVYGAMHFLGWDAVLMHNASGAKLSLSLAVGIVGVVATFALFVCTGMIYACIKFLQEWASPLTVVNYTVFGIASGFTLATAFAAYRAPDLMDFYGVWAITLTVAAFITRSASLIRNARIKHKSSLQTAIGIRHTRVQQKAQGQMGGSFNTRDFFHGKTVGFLKSVKWIFMVLVFPVPLLLLWIGMAHDAPAVLAAAFATQYVGLIAERWFFFAQANHPQNLYYQTI